MSDRAFAIFAIATLILVTIAGSRVADVATARMIAQATSCTRVTP